MGFRLDLLGYDIALCPFLFLRENHARHYRNRRNSRDGLFYAFLATNGDFEMTTFTYYKLNLKLLTEQLGTCTEVSIYEKHVQEKAKKEIADANRLAKKLSKYKGVEFSDEKQAEELKGILRSYMQRSGVLHELPNTIPELVELAALIKEEFESSMDEGGSAPTVFMRDKDGFPMISTHMILGNLKENLKIMTNNGDKSIAKSKVSVGEMGALDIKVVEDFIIPSMDIIRNDEGKPQLLERPIKFERMGKVETAICRSEYLPIGTEYECTLRIRTGSPMNNLETLKTLFDLGLNNGLGQWRGSGKKGSYTYKVEPITYKEKLPEGWGR